MTSSHHFIAKVKGKKTSFGLPQKLWQPVAVSTGGENADLAFLLLG